MLLREEDQLQAEHDLDQANLRYTLNRLKPECLFISSKSKRLSPSIPSKHIFTLPGSLCTVSPFTTECGISRKSLYQPVSERRNILGGFIHILTGFIKGFSHCNYCGQIFRSCPFRAFPVRRPQSELWRWIPFLQ